MNLGIIIKKINIIKIIILSLFGFIFLFSILFYDVTIFPTSSSDIEGLKDYSPTEVLDEYYNLIGTKDYANITQRNSWLKNYFSINNNLGNYSKKDLTKPYEKDIKKKKMILANYYLYDESLSDSQRNFLYWHFSSPYNYNNSTIVFSHNEPDYVVGWNSNVTVDKFNKIYTFGLIGCTCIICYSNDGNISVSHFDGRVNPLQKRIVSDFSRDHILTKMYIIGHIGKEFLNSINETIDYDIFLHEKKSTKTTYSILISKNSDKINLTSPIMVSYASLPITSNYIPSIHHGNYGRYFSEGNASEIYPPVDQQFYELEFIKI